MELSWDMQRQMKHMKNPRIFTFALVLILASAGVAEARGVRLWSYQELLDKSDLVVIATVTNTGDTKERIDLPGFDGQHVVGVETKFNVSAVLKGNKEVKDIVLHHYRDDGVIVPNGPTFVAFDSAQKRPLLLFLVREADGRYAPVVGQTDPALGGINVLKNANAEVAQ
jgi:hypothetical protein